jgi:hypothetical protein
MERVNEFFIERKSSLSEEEDIDNRVAIVDLMVILTGFENTWQSVFNIIEQNFDSGNNFCTRHLTNIHYKENAERRNNKFQLLAAERASRFFDEYKKSKGN